jgi:hypothetical protein
MLCIQFSLPGLLKGPRRQEIFDYGRKSKRRGLPAGDDPHEWSDRSIETASTAWEPGRL